MVKITNKVANEKKRKEVINQLTKFFINLDEDIMQVAQNKIAFPFVNELNNDEWVEITISIPTGARGENGYDGFEQAEQFRQKEEEKKIKAEEKRIEKEKKKERDKKMREQKAKQKAEQENNK